MGYNGRHKSGNFECQEDIRGRARCYQKKASVHFFSGDKCCNDAGGPFAKYHGTFFGQLHPPSPSQLPSFISHFNFFRPLNFEFTESHHAL